jgi:hypothetical protein
LHDTETAWMQHRSSDRLTLAEQLDCRRGVTRQFSIAQHRVAYGKNGTYLAGAIFEESTSFRAGLQLPAPFYFTPETGRFLGLVQPQSPEICH